MEEIYLNDKTYDRLVAALAAIKPDAFSGKVESDQIKEALGEVADIWPARIEREHLKSKA